MSTRDDPESERLRVAIYRRMTPEQRLLIAARLYDESLAIVRDSVLARNPDISLAELQQAVRERVLGRELARQGRTARSGNTSQAPQPESPSGSLGASLEKEWAADLY